MRVVLAVDWFLKYASEQALGLQHAGADVLLICREHLMPLIRARMIDQGEDFHIAVFPGAFSLHIGPRLEEPDREGQFFWGHTLTRADVSAAYDWLESSSQDE